MMYDVLLILQNQRSNEVAREEGERLMRRREGDFEGEKLELFYGLEVKEE